MSKWYSLLNILPYKKRINLIFGGRTTGKTYAWKEFILSNFQENFPELSEKYIEFLDNNDTSGDFSKFVYVRRKETEVKKTAVKLFTDIIAKYNKEFKTSYAVIYRAETFLLCNRQNESDGKGSSREKFVPIRTIGYSIPLTLAEQYKTASFEDCKYVIFEECLALNRRTYLDNEVDLFVDLINTILRQRQNTYVFMIANIASKVNPYFLQWKIKPVEGTQICAYRNIDILVDILPKSTDRIYDIESGDLTGLGSDNYLGYNLGESTLDDESESVIESPESLKPLLMIENNGYNFYIYAMNDKLYVSNKIMPIMAESFYIIGDDLQYSIDYTFDIVYTIKSSDDNKYYLTKAKKAKLLKIRDFDGFRYNDHETVVLFQNFIESR